MAAAHLDDSARQILDQQANGVPGVPHGIRFTKVFSYGKRSDQLVLLASALCGVIAGALNPILTVIYGQFVGLFTNFDSESVHPDEMQPGYLTLALYFVYLAIALFVFSTLSTLGFYLAGERTVRSLRIAFVKAVIRQNIAFSDLLSAGELSSSLMSDTDVIHEGITSKTSIALTSTSTFVSALVIAFIMYWKTALILLPAYIIIVVIATTCGKYVVKYQRLSKARSAYAVGIAEEAISSPRHVAAYGLQTFLVDMYNKSLSEAEIPGIHARKITAGLVAWLSAMPCLVYALVFWSGTYFIGGELSITQLTTTALTTVIGAFAVIRVTPSVEALLSTVSSANALLQTIARRSPIDPLATSGEKPSPDHLITGQVEFRNISLAYPSRPEVLVLDDVSFTCPAGKKTAIIGASGNGKSSLLDLLERFYSPIRGGIFLDEFDIQSLHLGWLRQQVSFVQQEPVLFNTTIAENIICGLRNTAATDTSLVSNQRQRMIDAATRANAHDFISALPNGYDTQVGEKGARLSGGQRQRIAIARALIRDPAVLLLDEATSALDSKSEAAVQHALDTAAQSRTTIVVAHRLSTIRSADHIVVLASGKVAEQGTHEELLDLQGTYASLVAKQQIESFDHASVIGDSESQDFSSSYSAPGEGRDEKAIKLEQDRGVENAPNNGPSHAHDIDQDKSDHSGFWTTMMLIHSFTRHRSVLMLGGFMLSGVAGLGVPGQSVVFAKLLSSLSLLSVDASSLRQKVDLYSGLYLILAAVAFLSYLGFGIIFSYTTAELSRAIRTDCLQSILSQEVEYFDQNTRQGRGTASLMSILTVSVDAITALSGPILGGVLTFMATIITCIILALAVGWKLALVCAATIPLVFACGWVRLRMLSILDATRHRHGAEARAHAIELIKLVRTVASLGIEHHVLHQYEAFLATQAGASRTPVIRASVLYGASQSVVYLCAALAFWYGGTLIEAQEYSLFQFYLCFAALISGTQTAGSVFSHAPDASKAMQASFEVQEMLSANKSALSEIDLTDRAASVLPTEAKAPVETSLRHQDWTGSIEFKDVTFSYASRMDRLALNCVNLKIRAGQHVGLVGASGSGKSTIINLVERFYSAAGGRITLDARDISKLNLSQYREMIALVSQDTTLYAGNIRSNIAIGKSAGQAEVPDTDVVEACKQANLMEWIDSLPDGIYTNIGPGGCMLSGGQKQRIAIARALLKSPKVLLLDEATSALDAASEVVVQSALDKAAKGRTTISVAHRLSSIVHADVIFVLEDGRVIEEGSHQELMGQRGKYHEMVKLQML